MRLKLLLGGVCALLATSVPVSIAAEPPAIDATSALVIDARDGQAVYRDDPDRRSQIASTTKLMTALLTLEELPLDKVLTAPKYSPSSPDESLANLRTGERMDVSDLLRALLLESANDAAVTLAQGVSGSQKAFVAAMNRRAKQLGLNGTRYQNPIGLDSARNYSTARDLARLTGVLMRNEFFRGTVKMPEARLLSGSYPRTIENRNVLVGRYPWITGVKTGYTPGADYVLVGSGTRGRADLISVVLGTPSPAARNADTLALLNYGFTFFKQVKPVTANATLAEAKVDYYRNKEIPLVGPRDIIMSVRRNQRVRLKVDAPDVLEGPLPQGRRVGTVAVLVGGKQAQTVPLVTGEAVPKAGSLRKIGHYVFRWQVLLVVLAIVAIVVFRRRRRKAAAETARRRRREAARLE